MLATFNIQAIQKFYQDHKEFINNLISGGLPTLIPVVIAHIPHFNLKYKQITGKGKAKNQDDEEIEY